MKNYIENKIHKKYSFVMQFKSYKCVFVGKINEKIILIDEKQTGKSQDCS